MKRREFLKNSLAVSSLAGLSTAGYSLLAADATARRQEYYELRTYHLKDAAARELLEQYLERAAIPAFNRLGSRPIGVFHQQQRETPKGETEVRDPLSVVVLIPYPSLEAFAMTGARLHADPEHLRAGSEYLQRAKASPVFERIDSWLLLAFAGLPRLEEPAYCRERKPRMFELRTYESYSEVKALKKVEMFNSGEINVMREVGLGPIFFGQALIGPALPHLTYMLSAENPEAHKQHWDAFGKHAVWNKLKNDPQYADTVSQIRNRFLVPARYSQI